MNMPALILMKGTDGVIEEAGLHAGLPYSVLGLAMGHRCGYVAVPFAPGLAQGDYSYDPILDDVDVHGGVTYANRVGDWVVYGFDCAHVGDARDTKLLSVEYMRVFSGLPSMGGVVRSRGYVASQCREFASQLRVALVEHGVSVPARVPDIHQLVS